jgi:hypothetical protein
MRIKRCARLVRGGMLRGGMLRGGMLRGAQAGARTGTELAPLAVPRAPRKNCRRIGRTPGIRSAPCFGGGPLRVLARFGRRTQ